MANNEADGILLLALKQAGVSLPDQVNGMKDFDASVVIGVTSQTLKLIHAAAGTSTPQIVKLPETLPANVAARHRVCTLLGKLIKALGYMGESGYNQFLYPNDKDVRNLVMWLVEKLPKDEGKNDSIGSGSLLRHKIMTSLKSWSKRTWVPPFATGAPVRGTVQTCPLHVPQSKGGNDLETAYYNSARMVDITKQVSLAPHLAPSIMEANAMQTLAEIELENIWGEAGSLDMTQFRKNKINALANILKSALVASNAGQKGREVDADNGKDYLEEIMKAAPKEGDERSRFKNQTDFTQEQADIPVDEETAEEQEKDAESVKQEREKEISELENKLQLLLSKLTSSGKKISVNEEKKSEVKSKLSELELEISSAEKEYKVRSQTLKMLPNAEENIKKLEGICAASRARLEKFAEEWEKVKTPLMKEYEEIKASVTRRKEEGRWKVGEMRRMREEMRTMAGSIREAEERYKLLSDEFEKMPKNINRAVYTYRIMDIIKQIRKQQGEVDRIVSDIRSVQRALNVVSQKLSRTEAITDEHVFQAASSQKNDPAYIQAYRSLANVREIFDDLVATAEEGGKLESATRDFENRAKQLENRITSQNMERVVADLESVKKENIKLAKAIKKARIG
jgi:coiled-coil domain-containing protein 22